LILSVLRIVVFANHAGANPRQMGAHRLRGHPRHSHKHDGGRTYCISLQQYPILHLHLVPGNLMGVLLTGYPIMVGGTAAPGSQELIAKFGPIFSTGALWYMWIVHGTDWLISPVSMTLLVISSICIKINSPQAPGSQGQLSTNQFTQDLCACGPLVTLIG
jgi:hypothetical protein